MGRIEIISASAGSGKTTRLAEVLEQGVVSGAVRTDAVLATTFTNKAAAELEERVRVRLLAEGRVEAAHRLAAARIGTVNAVCSRLVGDFAFALGISPRLQVLDEPAAEAAFARALSAVLGPTENDELADLASRLEGFDGARQIEQVVQLARTNGLGPAALEDCARRSAAGFAALLGPSENKRAASLERALARAIDRFVAAVDLAADPTDGTATYLKRVQRARQRLGLGRALAWSEWAWLAKSAPCKTSRELAAPIARAAAAHDGHQLLRQDGLRAIALVFELAAAALTAYQDYKRAAMVIDFVDQEVLALQLLRLPELGQELAGQLDLVLVDEFQDTSPLQLAIFLELARIARRSVWVGDQKQAIFGFRGTDPALMDAALAQILGADEPVTLERSWRSRPRLVQLTSALFTQAFASQGLPPARVQLRPARAEEPAGLGPTVERWRLGGRTIEAQLAALAAGVRALLADDTLRVRDRDTGEARPAQPGDVALLCRKNEQCRQAAAALEALGLQAVLPRPGLLATPEALLCLAGLRLWHDPQSSLAAAEIARLVTYPEDAEGWLEAVLAQPGRAFDELAPVARLRQARRAGRTLGLLAVLDQVQEALQLRELCLRWGDASQRLGNLDALRALVAAHAARCRQRGRGGTLTGLLEQLTELAGEQDAQALLAARSAVVLSTWHAAKGLEWPVTILVCLRDKPRATALGVHLVSDRAQLDIADPLAERWIRYWPALYGRGHQGTPFAARLAQDPATAAAALREEREALRLLYVGWTRARDRLALATGKGTLDQGLLAALRGADGHLLPEPGPKTRWAGLQLVVPLRELTPAAPQQTPLAPDEGYLAAGPRDYPPAFAQPSAAQGSAATLQVETIGAPLPAAAVLDWHTLGNAVHSFFAAHGPESPAAARQALAAEVLARWQLSGVLAPAQLVAWSQALQAWVAQRLPAARWRREWPVQQRLPAGTVLRGSVDLLLESTAGLVVLDHKLIHGAAPAALERARSYAGQLAAYRQALAAATARPCLGCFLHLPAQGLVARVGEVMS